MKTLKWLGIAAVVVFFLILNAILLLMSGANQREAAIQPLSVEELQRLAPKAGEGATPAQKRVKGDSTPNLPGQRASEGGKDKAVDHSAREAVLRGDTNVNGHGDAADGGLPGEEATPALRPAQPLRLASRPTREQIAEHFSRWGPDEPEWWKRKYEASVTRVLLPVIGMAFPDDADITGIPGTIGNSYIRAEDFDSAVPYLREAVRIEKDEGRRRRCCCALAWLEEDPEVAAELVVLSCQGERDAFYSPHAAYIGIELAVLTHSEELTEYVFLNYRDSWSQWFAAGHAYSPEVRAWLEARLARRK